MHIVTKITYCNTQQTALRKLAGRKNFICRPVVGPH